MTEPLYHAHGYIRVRKMPSLLRFVLVRVGLTRLVVSSGDLPCSPECTDYVGVTKQEARS